MQVPWLVQMAQRALEEGKCVVIGLQSTGEARTADLVAERGEELDDFISGPKVMAAVALSRCYWLGRHRKGGGWSQAAVAAAEGRTG